MNLHQLGKLSMSSRYEQWFYTAKDPKYNYPYGTLMMYQVCEQDSAKFKIAEGIMQIAFKAGVQAEKEFQRANINKTWAAGIVTVNDKIQQRLPRITKLAIKLGFIKD
jgi:hypothetical protein